MAMNLTSKPIDLPIQDTVLRLVESIEWWLPVKLGTTPHSIMVGIFIAVMLIYAFFKSRDISKDDCKISRAYIFYGIWLLSCSLPFLFLSKYFWVRYFYVSYIALTTISFVSIYQILILPRKHKQLISSVLLALVFSLYGAQRYFINKGLVDRLNREYEAVTLLLRNEHINADTQIALVNMTKATGGHYIWSSGYLQYLLREPGVRGIIGNELHFYDPFNLQHCDYQHTMSCIDPNKELIAFRGNIRYKSVRMTYFLQWISKGNIDSEWFLYSTNKENKLRIIDSGLGLKAYKSSLSQLDFDPEQVFWGNYNIKNSLPAF